MTIQITVRNDAPHRGTIRYDKRADAERCNSEFCTNEVVTLDKTSLLTLMAIKIEKFARQTTRSKKGYYQTTTGQIALTRHDSDKAETQREYSRMLYVLADKMGKALFASQDKAFIQRKADYLTKYPAEIQRVKQYA